MTDVIEKYIERNEFRDFTPKAVLFDMDGVLYNSMPYHAQAWKQCMEKHGLRMTEADAYLYEGMRGVETIQLLAGKQWNRTISDEEAAYIYRCKSEIYSSFPAAKKIEGVYKLMQNIERHGWKIGVVTGSGQLTLIQRILDDFKGLVSPDIIISAKDVLHGKPAPDPYLRGMFKAGTLPWQTIVVENAPLGVRAAVKARCFTVAVNTGPLPDCALEKEGADMVLTSMDDFNTFLEKMYPVDDDNHVY